ncbi:hypothetical protein COCNU_01G018660 [Cocos nucifera]|uniref:Uncharacterized protein n=1 Tax=Cocos nucifera TaxID=13894 RepID=A0A8K0HWI0_COCNU|nr:hypothetical protein COCNU_01G018660 [Cocos nucifera]
MTATMPAAGQSYDRECHGFCHDIWRQRQMDQVGMAAVCGGGSRTEGKPLLPSGGNGSSTVACSFGSGRLDSGSRHDGGGSAWSAALPFGLSNG